jgi:hypothetical protein
MFSDSGPIALIATRISKEGLDATAVGLGPAAESVMKVLSEGQSLIVGQAAGDAQTDRSGPSHARRAGRRLAAAVAAVPPFGNKSFRLPLRRLLRNRHGLRTS